MARKSHSHSGEMSIQVEEPVVEYRNRTIETNSYGLNPAQLHLLKMFSVIKTEETFQDLKKILREFYIQQVEKEADKHWDEGKIGYELLNEHLRIPYK
jgi:hypothetical protein